MKTRFLNELQIVHKEYLSSQHAIIYLRASSKLPKILPGQFVNILVKDTNTFLRRPISIHDVDYQENTLSIFVKSVGVGSHKIVRARKGSKLNTLYPLGNSFSIVSNKKVLLAGGGFGVAPLYLLSKILQKRQNNISLLVGAKTKKEVLLVNKFKGLANIFITTEDGSLGEKGVITEHSILQKEKFDFIYNCGPTPMMKAMAKCAKQKEITCEVSLENMMACGFGVCLCCVVKTKKGNVCSCTEGPVYNSEELLW